MVERFSALPRALRRALLLVLLAYRHDLRPAAIRLPSVNMKLPPNHRIVYETTDRIENPVIVEAIVVDLVGRRV